MYNIRVWCIHTNKLLLESLFFLVVNASKYSLCICTICIHIHVDKSGYSEPSNFPGSRFQAFRLWLCWLDIARNLIGCHGTVSWRRRFSKGGFMTSLQVWKWPIAYGIALEKVLFHLFIVFSSMERTWRNLGSEMTITHRPTGICDDQRIIRFIRKTWRILNNVFSCENHTWPKSAKPVP